MKKRLQNLFLRLREGIKYLKCGKGSEIINSFWQNIIIIVSVIVILLLCCKIIIGIFSENDKRNYTDCMLPENAVRYADIEEGGGNDDTAAIKRAYLTFDDGPSKYTDEILDILAENNIKATFFVIGKDETYYDKYRRIVNEGHTLALHSFSHNYGEIYSSLDNFAADIEELRNLLYDVTGVNCIYYRFPGGSSNTVSSVSMDTLVDYVNSRGLVYFDWNALNGDSVSAGLSASELVDNVMKDALRYDDTVILLHDLEDRHTTVESLQLLIDELKEAGYEILPIDENTPLIRHSIN